MTSDEIYDLVDEHIQKLINTFPTELKEEAEKLPCFLSDVMNVAFGVYWNDTIVIYVDMVWQHCQKNGDDFLKFIECVYLHELGHHLNLNEFELKERGL